MALAAGTRIGPYEIVSALGEGGMGVVYRARDSRLHRDVALKVLPEAFAGDADRLTRFQREAHVLASLSHPNIAAIYGIEPVSSSGQGTALVMELVEGEDLSAVIRRGPLALADALRIARQITDALEAAHELGIVHRDLKPANVKVKADGTVKVLDFGLAKAADAGLSPGEEATLTSPAITKMGLILGTAAYMAPEQARGRAVDRRADIWAFGVVVYEMLSGRRAFDGEDVSITIASVLRDDVKWHALPQDVPASVRRLLRRCLEKDPKKRLSAIGDARIEIDESSAAGEETETARGRAPAARTPWIIAAAAMLVAIASVAYVFWPRAIEPGPRMYFQVPAVSDYLGPNVFPQLSPDGRFLAYSSPPPNGGPTRIWVRELDSPNVRAIPGTDGGGLVFWAMDSKDIGYFAGGKVYRVSATGGTPELLSEIPNANSAAWLPSGDILVTTNPAGGRKNFRVPRGGGPPVEVWSPGKEGPSSLSWPAMLPDGRHFLAVNWTTSAAERSIYVASIEGGQPVHLISSTSQALYASPGFLVFMRGTSLFAQPFDANSRALRGDAVKIADDVAINAMSGRASFSVSTNGLLAYLQVAPESGMSELTWFDRTGKPINTVGGARQYYQIRLSPDGRRVAFAELTPNTFNYSLGVLDLGNGVASAIGDDALLANDPVWSPDSQTIAYEAIRAKGIRQLYTHRVGSPEFKTVFESPDDPKWLDDWSADGRFLLFHLPKPSKLFALPLDGTGTVMKLLETGESVDSAHFSPDGKWIAYNFNESGTYQIWVAAFPAFDRRQRVSPDGGGQPFWRSDGKELFYLSPTGKLMSVRLTEQAGSLNPEAPVELFQSPTTAPAMGIDLYSPSKDGQRFLFIRPKPSAGGKTTIAVVVNWAAGLGRN